MAVVGGTAARRDWRARRGVRNLGTGGGRGVESRGDDDRSCREANESPFQVTIGMEVGKMREIGSLEAMIKKGYRGANR